MKKQLSFLPALLQKGNFFSSFLLVIILSVIPVIMYSQAPEQDCLGAIKVCQNTYVQNNAYSGYGLIQDLGSSNNTCLQNNESNSAWYIFTVTKSGSLNFQISPLNQNDDYDYALFNLTGSTCTDIFDGIISPIRCNYSSTPGNTGLKPGFTGNSVASGGPNQCASILVNSGQTYALLVNNFTSTQTGYSLTFSGTASIFDSNVPDISTVTSSSCSPKYVTLTMSENIQCNTISPDGSDFIITGPSTVNVISATSTSCTSGTLTTNIVIKFSEAINVPGTYKITVATGSDTNSVSDLCGNQLPTGLTRTFKVDFEGPVSKIVSYTNAKCNNADGVAIASATGGTSPFSYQWNTSPAQTGSTATGLAPGTYTVTVIDDNGCKATSNVIISNDGAPNVTITTTNLKCKDEKTGAATITLTGGSPPFKYNWNTNPVQNGSTASGLEEGSYMVSITDAAGCITIKTVKITSASGILLSTGQTPSDCGNSTGSATVNVSGGVKPYTYLWNTSPVQTTQALSNIPAGIYNVIVTDSNNCKKAADIFISNTNGPNGSVTVTKDATCGDPNGSITVSATGGTPPYSYLWNTSQVQIGPTAKGLSSNTYQVAITDAVGCMQILSVKINDISGPKAVLSTMKNATCGNANGSATVVASGGSAPYTYNWSMDPQQNTSTATGLPAGSFSVFISDTNLCNSDTLIFNIGEHGGTSSFISTNACAGKEVTFHGSSTLKPKLWAWDFGDPLSGDANKSFVSNPVHTFSEPGTYTVKMYVEGGCEPDSVISKVTVYPDPIVTFTPTLPEITASSEVGFIYGGSPSMSYQWDFGDGSTSVSSYPSHIFREEGNYTITVNITSLDGCTGTYSQILEVLKRPDVYLPNAFTPDDDDVNDRFRPIGRGIEEIDFRIFNRWGQMIYISKNVMEATENGWDGKVNGDKIKTPQVFVYLVNGKFTNGIRFDKSGSVILLPQ